MATIDVRPDNIATGVWWLIWIERDEIIAKVEQDSGDSFKIVPEGPHWNPMKSFGACYVALDQAVSDVRLYFEGR
jgi:hypothetical protein